MYGVPSFVYLKGARKIREEQRAVSKEIYKSNFVIRWKSQSILRKV